MSNQFFIAPDGADEPSLWLPDLPHSPTLVLRKAELPGPYDELLWRVVTGVLAPDEATVEQVARTLYVHGDDLSLDEEIRSRYRKQARAVLAALADPAETGDAA